jgi:AraC-like DNA-binding protein
MKRRIESAKLIMRQGHSSLAEIAIRCGFADQSHFTRAFSRETGASPGQWRRCISA